MKKSFLLLFLFLILPAFNVFCLFQQVQGLESVQIKRTAVSFFNPSLIYVASKNSLYKSKDAGKTFKRISVFKDEQVQHIFFDQHLADTLYLATTRHLYKISDNIEKIFSSSDETAILNAARHKGVIYIGTTRGLYYAQEDILSWRKLRGFKSQGRIYYIEPSKENLFLATSKGVYLVDKSNRAKRVFVIRDSEEEEFIATLLLADIFKDDTIYLGTNRGVYFSSDNGSSWKKLYIEGVSNLSINCMAQTSYEKNSLYLAADKGFFKVDLKNKSSEHIFEGIYSREINWVEFYSKGKILLSTPKGLFSSDYFTKSYAKYTLEEILEKEPSIGEIQQAVLRYNEVGPDKIKKWRNSLKYRALFPSISLDYDKTISLSTNPNYYESVVGPRDWGFSLSWDVGNLIWNSYEDDVDTRARLNTQLRLDVLDEINRVYFERLRLVREVSTSSLSGKELFKKKLRLEELTATIDGYTGGCLSKRLRELNEEQ